MSLTRLIKIMPPPLSPKEVGSEAKWLEIEQECGIVFPSDYKAFIQTYGTGHIGDFLQIWNPFSSNPYINLLPMFRRGLGILKHRKDLCGDEYPHVPYPEERGLLPFASTPNGDALCWKTNGNQEQWTLLFLDEFGPQYEEYQLSLTEFLVAIIKGELTNSIFSDDEIFDRKEGFLPLP